jgi:hypothetical protein
MTAGTPRTFGNEWRHAYNKREEYDAREPIRGGKMRKTLTTFRCVPRYGFDHAEVRTIDLELVDLADEQEILHAARTWFAQRGIADAVYDVAVDNDGFFVVINDEAYHQDWGEALF